MLPQCVQHHFFDSGMNRSAWWSKKKHKKTRGRRAVPSDCGLAAPFPKHGPGAGSAQSRTNLNQNIPIRKPPPPRQQQKGWRPRPAPSARSVTGDGRRSRPSPCLPEKRSHQVLRHATLPLPLLPPRLSPPSLRTCLHARASSLQPQPSSFLSKLTGFRFGNQKVGECKLCRITPRQSSLAVCLAEIDLLEENLL